MYHRYYNYYFLSGVHNLWSLRITKIRDSIFFLNFPSSANIVSWTEAQFHYMQEMSQIYNEKKSSYDSLSAGFETNRSKLEQVSHTGQPDRWIQIERGRKRHSYGWQTDTCRDRGILIDWQRHAHRLTEAYSYTDRGMDTDISTLRNVC